MPIALSPKMLIIPLAGTALAFAAILMSAQTGGAQIPPAQPTPAAIPTPVTLNPFSGGSSSTTAPAPGAVPGFRITGDVSICGVANPGALGGQTITDSTGALSINLVDGGNYSYGTPSASVGQPALAICHQQTNSTLVISLATGKEITRVVRSSLATSIFNNILANTVVSGGQPLATTGAAPLATTGSTTAPVAGSASGPTIIGGPLSGPAASSALGPPTGIRAPNTGDAGLLEPQ